MLPTRDPALTVYFDGACPLCAREIAFYRRSRGAERVAFVDVAQGEALGPGLDRATALARFHVRDAEGRLASGAAGFARLWAQLPAWRLLALVLRLPGALWLAERAYRAFLPLRPFIAKVLPSDGPACRDGACTRPPSQP
ncbi:MULTISPECIES: DUF393 domain-containing protein [unclassified Methylobacterium]|uniref:thiol-disulfide oxidoreductase DCC family protein n=1 Tax=unclassified Methylobacterium TaxID=2615210 RepID=UPI0006FB5057|nr:MULTISPECIES: DUF393 domain-containing protein [unclassified Methylobacterium]KQP51460.1 thiol-disulfide oxidoreductase [Methylobacterium sp. Leaf108]KQT77390.1 thiol-disulfide oxidoreductase [Methylobacterium sp. Leaf466]